VFESIYVAEFDEMRLAIAIRFGATFCLAKNSLYRGHFCLCCEMSHINSSTELRCISFARNPANQMIEVSILTQTILDCAMHYSRLGLAVLPLHYPVPNKDGSVCSCGRSDCTSAAKHPVGHLVPNGIKNSTTEPQLLERWFKDTSWNVGIVTGSKSGIIVADFDPVTMVTSPLVSSSKDTAPYRRRGNF
jgi:hypothetical protein